MTESVAMPNSCEHDWQYNKPAHASASVRICALCHTIDGEDLMRTLDEYAAERLAALKQRPTTLLYAHSDGEVYSYIDQPGGIPDSAREQAILRGVLTHVLRTLDEHENPLRAAATFPTAVPD
ncbi:hypothetical protein G3I51_24300 [Streptomyces sp. SID9944]|nr:hypothetical protein [Streptomyces sp. SID9944]